MSRLISLAIILISTFSSLAKAENQKAYRCGNTYSQIPCPGGVTVDTADNRSKAQKTQSESVIKRDMRTANGMEKTRLQQEEARRRAALKSADKPADKAAPTPGNPTQSTKKKSRPPEYFTARTPGDKKKKKSGPASQSTTPAATASAPK
jgi:hypothetical protein